MKDVKNKNKSAKSSKTKRNNFIMKCLVFFGVIIFLVAIVYLMNYFFVEKNDIKINMSTDKKLENMVINGKEELITTQKYVSDLEYTMRYDINKFTVFKYKGQDFYRFLDAEKILLVVEKSVFPQNCTNADLNTNYNSCIVKVDDFTDEYYISSNGKSYKLTVKSPNTDDYLKNVKVYIDYMLDTFKIN